MVPPLRKAEGKYARGFACLKSGCIFTKAYLLCIQVLIYARHLALVSLCHLLSNTSVANPYSFSSSNVAILWTEKAHTCRYETQILNLGLIETSYRVISIYTQPSAKK